MKWFLPVGTFQKDLLLLLLQSPVFLHISLTQNSLPPTACNMNKNSSCLEKYGAFFQQTRAQTTFIIAKFSFSKNIQNQKSNFSESKITSQITIETKKDVCNCFISNFLHFFDLTFLSAGIYGAGIS